MKSTAWGQVIYDEFTSAVGDHIKVLDAAFPEHLWVSVREEDDASAFCVVLLRDEAERLRNALQAWLDGFQP